MMGGLRVVEPVPAGKKSAKALAALAIRREVEQGLRGEILAHPGRLSNILLSQK